MNSDYKFFEACYKICSINTFTTGVKNIGVEIPITDSLSAKTILEIEYAPDPVDGLVKSDFKIIIYRDGEPIEEIVFHNSLARAEECQRVFLDQTARVDDKLRAMEALKPGKVSTFLRKRTNLTDQEMSSVMDKAEEMRAFLLEHKEAIDAEARIRAAFAEHARKRKIQEATDRFAQGDEMQEGGKSLH